MRSSRRSSRRAGRWSRARRMRPMPGMRTRSSSSTTPRSKSSCGTPSKEVPLGDAVGVRRTSALRRTLLRRTSLLRRAGPASIGSLFWSFCGLCGAPRSCGACAWRCCGGCGGRGFGGSRRHVAARHLHQAQFVGVQLQRGELAAPHRAGVDGVHAVADEQAQRRPVAADDLEVALDAAGHFVPRVQADRLRAGAALVLERDPPARRAIAQPREHVDDRAMAVEAGQFRMPGAGRRRTCS